MAAASQTVDKYCALLIRSPVSYTHLDVYKRQTGVGVEGLGKPFTTSEFLLTVSDQELLDFIKTGRPISHPDNTTGVDMPPKGGNPALTDEQLTDIIAYIRTLHE